MGKWPVSVIPNRLDVNRWAPFDRTQSRQLLNLPPEVPLIAFGAFSGTRDEHKGFDILAEAVRYLNNKTAHPRIELLVFGESRANQMI
jgi:glycosyltransferase involved in cell wall biosynthesis